MWITGLFYKVKKWAVIEGLQVMGWSRGLVRWGLLVYKWSAALLWPKKLLDLLRVNVPHDKGVINETGEWAIFHFSLKMFILCGVFLFKLEALLPCRRLIFLILLLSSCFISFALLLFKAVVSAAPPVFFYLQVLWTFFSLLKTGLRM